MGNTGMNNSAGDDQRSKQAARHCPTKASKEPAVQKQTEAGQEQVNDGWYE